MLHLLRRQSRRGSRSGRKFSTLRHPNAARVFINWLLSRSGQIALQRRTARAESPADSLRIDIAKDEVPFEQRCLPDIKYLDTGKPDWMDMKQVLDVVNEALKAAGKN